MSNDLFRKESLNNVSSPEKLNDYIKVSNPSIWLILIATIILLISFLGWCFVGNLPSTIEVNTMVKENEAICYLSEDDAKNLKNGMEVNFEDSSKGTITSISELPLSSEEVSHELESDYIYKNLCNSEWNTKVTMSVIPESKTQKLVNAQITTSTVKPITFLFN